MKSKIAFICIGAVLGFIPGILPPVLTRFPVPVSRNVYAGFVISFFLLICLVLSGYHFSRSRRHESSGIKKSGPNPLSDEEKFSLAYDFSPVPLAISTLDEGSFININRSFEELFGYERKYAIGKTSAELNIFVDKDARSGLVEGLLHKDKIEGKEIFYRNIKGEVFEGETSTEVIQLNGRKCLLYAVQDISERKEIERRLRENELRILQIVQGIAIPTFVIDSNHRVIQWNTASERLFNVSAHRMLGTCNHWSVFYHQQRHTLADLIIDRASDDEFTGLYADKWRTSSLVDGGVEAEDYFSHLGNGGMWLFFTAAPIRDRNGQIIAAIETIQDVTESRLASESLKDSEMRYRLLYNSMRDALILIDNMGCVEQVNPAALSMFGYTENEFIGLRLDELFNLASRSIFTSMMYETYSQRYSSSYEALMERRDGEVINVEVRAYQMRDDEGRSIGSWSIIRDISNRKHSESLLKIQHQLAMAMNGISDFDGALSALLSCVLLFEGIDCGGVYLTESSSDAILLNNARGVSDNFITKMSRYENDHILREVYREGVPRYWNYEDLKDEVFFDSGEGILSTGFVPIAHRGGMISGIIFGSRTLKLIPVETRNGVETLVSQAGSAVSRILVEEELRLLNEKLEQHIRDRTTELQMANDRLQESLETLNSARDQLVQTEKMAALGGLVAGVAHEINTPVGIGITASSFLRDEAVKLRKKEAIGTEDLNRFISLVIEGSSSILTNLTRAAELVTSFKQVAVDQSTEERRLFSVKEYTEEILMSLQARYRRSGHRVLVECPEDLVIDSYPGVFAQVITNLITNSHLHGFDGMSDGTIMLNFSRDGDDLLFIYSDNGHGMSGETLKKMFDPFYTTRRGRGGTGLGMHIVFNLITGKLKGTIQVFSEPGHGASFYIHIPLYSD